MSRRSFVPPASRSPYEEQGKRTRPAANNKDPGAEQTTSVPTAPRTSERPGQTAAEMMKRKEENVREQYRWYARNLFSEGVVLVGMDPSSPVEKPDPIDAQLAAARKPIAEYLLTASHTVGWDDVIGNDKARTALLEAIEHPVVHAELFNHYGIKAPKGVLLYGPPGCGKTMFGKAAAAALGRLYGSAVEMLVINGPSIQSPWVGETEKVIREIFAYARLYREKHKHPLVVFIDEADAILSAREGGPHWNASNVATFLTEMDGLEDSGAFVILATNRPGALDEALLRDGRCDRKIKVERPDYDSALKIAGLTLGGADARWINDAKAADLIDYLFDPLHLLMALTNPETKVTHHFLLQHIVSGAMVVGLVHRAKGIAMRRDLAGHTVTGLMAGDLRAAVDEVLAEAKGLTHDYALREFVETVAIPFEEARKMRTLN